MIDGEAEREVKLRIMEVLFSDVIPDPRDIMIICLVDACGIFKELLSQAASWDRSRLGLRWCGSWTSSARRCHRRSGISN